MAATKAAKIKKRFLLLPKDGRTTLRIPGNVYETAKKIAKKRGITCAQLKRDAIADYLVKAA